MRDSLADFQIWLAPILVLAFIILLAMMYGWVGTTKSMSAGVVEPPETRFAATNVPYAQQGGQPFYGEQFPAGIGNENIRLLESVPIPTGIGNTQMNLMDINGMTVPSGQVQRINQNQLTTAYLGVYLAEIEPGKAQALGLTQNVGIYVREVVPSSPADKAGFMPNDLIVKCDRRKVSSLEQINSILTTKKPGEVVKFLIIDQNGKQKSLYAKLAENSSGLRAAAAQSSVWMGTDLQNIDAVMRDQMKLPDKRGVIVSQVYQNSPASAAGFRVGDVIKSLGETRVRDVKQFQSMILKKRAGEAVSMVIFRNGQSGILNLTLGQPPPVSSKAIPPIPPAEAEIEGEWIGMDVSELSPNDAADLGLPAGTLGMMVNDVESPPATMVGFQTGDIITAINGTPTPDMKQFVKASSMQTGAVVDVIRGNTHYFITVPPPGYTQQGTKIDTGQGNNFRQVAMTAPQPGTVAIFASNPNLNGYVSGEGTTMPYLILLNLQQNAFSILDRPSVSQLPVIFGANQVRSLICSYASPTTINLLSSMGIVVYSGVVGPASDALRLYQSGSFTPMQGQIGAGNTSAPQCFTPMQGQIGAGNTWNPTAAVFNRGAG